MKCKIQNCENEILIKCRQLCRYHDNRYKRFGDPLISPGRGNPGKQRPKRNIDGFRITPQGYREIRIQEGYWILEHRYNMEQKLNRKLYPNENVHHKDGNKLNNDIDNLELWIKYQPTGQRVEDLIKIVKEIIQRYSKL